jgi:hypothetical protein
MGLANDAGTQAAYQVDSVYVFETSGEAWLVRFASPIAQSNGSITLYVYNNAMTGTPTYKAEVRNGPSGANDPDRPESGGSVLGTSSDFSPTASRWSAVTITGITTVINGIYYIVIYNTHATPASNYCSFVYRGAADYNNSTATGNFYEGGQFQTGYTTDGFTSDPPVNSTMGTAVVKFDAGELIGFPYVGTESHASNANDRGNRVSFTENIKVVGHGSVSSTSTLDNISIYQGAAQIADADISNNPWQYNRACSAIYGSTELTKATDYDFVFRFGASTTSGAIYTMGEIEANVPTDVKNCRPGGVGGLVDGTAGSYTVDTSKLFSLVIWIEDLVSAAGGGGGMITHPGMSGGMRG